MIRTIVKERFADGKELVEIYCNSSEFSDLPSTGIAGGSKVIQTDEGDEYIYDETGGTWTKLGGTEANLDSGK